MPPPCSLTCIADCPPACLATFLVTRCCCPLTALLQAATRAPHLSTSCACTWPMSGTSRCACGVGEGVGLFWRGCQGETMSGRKLDAAPNRRLLCVAACRGGQRRIADSLNCTTD